MALVIEDGSGVSDADSFVTLAEVRAYALKRGVTLSNDDALLEPQVRKAHDYFFAVESQLKGSRAVAGQALPFPRKCVWLFGDALPDDVIPQQVKNAACQLVIESLTQDVMPSTDGKVVLQETVGPISTTYANTGVAGESPTFPRVDIMLAPLLQSGGAILTSIRV